MFILAFAILNTNVFAIVIDAQSETTCLSGVCETRVDLTKHMATLEVSNVKVIDYQLTKTEVLTNKNIKEFEISFDKDIMVFSGVVEKDTYWEFDLKNGYVIDPWWNISSVCNSSNLTYVNGNEMIAEDTTGYWQGIKITTNASEVFLVDYKLADHSTAERVAIADVSTHVFYADAVVIGDTATFNHMLTPETSYYMVLTNYSGDVEKGATAEISPFPISTTTGITIVASMYSASPYTVFNDYSLKLWEVGEFTTTINITCDVNTWYNTYLYLNGEQNNISITDSDTLNSTATTNLTGANALVYINDFLSANATTTATNTTTMPIGFFNITSFIGNTSTNETITYWVNVTEAVTEPSDYQTNETWRICSDNMTEHFHHAQYVNGTFSYSNDTYTYCQNECNDYNLDSLTGTLCNPDDLTQYLVLFGVVVVLVVLYGWLRKR